jgi:hypothetical protein
VAYLFLAKEEIDLGGKYLVFGSSRSVKMREADQKRLERSL